MGIALTFSSFSRCGAARVGTQVNGCGLPQLSSLNGSAVIPVHVFLFLLFRPWIIPGTQILRPATVGVPSDLLLPNEKQSVKGAMLSELQPGRKRKLPPSRPSISRASERARAATSDPAPDTSVGRRQRQPQISCDFCRHKKLKCDRARPCSNCVARGQACHGGPAAPFAPGLSNSTDILERLCRLEQAVFSAKDASNSQHNSPQAAGFRMETKPSTGCLPTPSLTELDYPFVGDIAVS